MSSNSTESDKKALTAVDERVLLIDGKFTHPNASRLDKIREAVARCARQLQSIVQEDPKHNVGRLIHTIDLLQSAKDTACVALLLPYANTDVRVAKD